MNLPCSPEDASLLQHEPLRSHIAKYKEHDSDLIQKRMVVNSFIKEMRDSKNGQAALACKAWAHSLFKLGTPWDESSLVVTDNGEALYKTFFEYQFRLSCGLKENNFSIARKFEEAVRKRGIGSINLSDFGGKARSKGQTNHRPSRPRRVSEPRNVLDESETGRHQGHIATSSIRDCAPPLCTHPAGARLSGSSDPPNPRKRSVSKKEKKRKPSSQEPPVVAPSDASEDDKALSKSHEVTVARSLSHRSKRVVANPCRPSRELRGSKHQAVKKDLVRGPEKTQCDGASNSQLLSGLPSDNTDSLHARLKKGERELGPPRSHRKHGDESASDISNRRSHSVIDPRGARKVKSIGTLPTHANKRPRRPSMSALDAEPGEVSEPTHNLSLTFTESEILQGNLVTGSLATPEKCATVKVRRKRTRPEFEFETDYAVTVEKVSVESREPLGPDVRPLRPLPRKISSDRVRLDKDIAVGVSLHDVPSQEYADQLVRGVGSNALAILHEGEVIGSDLHDWIEEQEQDTECDEDEADNEQITTTTLAAPTVAPKPPLPVRARIWAASRQEVCESLDYFRSYHSGVYSKDDIVRGYLLGAYAANRDIFHHSGKLIISHGGGKSESILDSRKGPQRYRYQTDQDQEATDKSVRALLRTWREQRPLVLLADDKYAHFPYDLASVKHTYVVLGHYWISHAWAECQSTRDGSGRIVRWKFAFQWCEGQDDPWWVPRDGILDEAPKPAISASNICLQKEHLPSTSEKSNTKCESCHEESPFIYQQGWICLNPLCHLFWTLDGEEPKQLDYREEFLKLVPHRFERLPKITPVKVRETPDTVTTTFAFSKGWHCTECGRLSSRYKWEHWECSNCGSQYVVKGRIRSPKDFWHQYPHKEFLHSRVGKDSGIVACRLEPIDLGACRGFTNRLTFILPHNRGQIHLILGTRMSNGDADNIFQLYQQQASVGELSLRRYPLRAHRARGQLLTNYFSQNSGEPYQYIGGTGNTVPFHEAPDCVRRALALIKERASFALGADIPFNEILSAAYMERQKMSFHSDSEKGLGPVVASLSMGSAALMHFRPHLNVEDPKSRGVYALSLILRHGDVLIMEGNGVQKYYEHTVVPMNFRIAATARCIGSA